MPGNNVQIDFNAAAVLRKWPSIKNERVSASLGASPYLVAEGTPDECMRQFMAKPINQHHLYEIHTAPQFDLVSAILSTKHIVELARLRDLLRGRSWRLNPNKYSKKSLSAQRYQRPTPFRIGEYVWKRRWTETPVGASDLGPDSFSWK
jgi:hypothetical protein